jgi:hypothetical protein
MSDPAKIVDALLETNEHDEQDDPKEFFYSHFRTPDKKHLFVGHEGDLYDMRKPDWPSGQPLRKGYQYFHRQINNVAQFKATWRARHGSNYPLAFLTDDGAALCETCVKENLPRIMSSIRGGDRDGWRVVGVAACHGDADQEEECHAQCAHCGNNLGELD